MITFVAQALAAADSSIDSPEEVITLANRVGGWLLGILLVLAGVFVVGAAYMFLTSGGDTEKVQKAKNQLLYAVVAVAVALLAKSVVKLVEVLIG